MCLVLGLGVSHLDFTDAVYHLTLYVGTCVCMFLKSSTIIYINTNTKYKEVLKQQSCSPQHSNTFPAVWFRPSNPTLIQTKQNHDWSLACVVRRSHRRRDSAKAEVPADRSTCSSFCRRLSAVPRAHHTHVALSRAVAVALRNRAESARSIDRLSNGRCAAWIWNLDNHTSHAPADDHLVMFESNGLYSTFVTVSLDVMIKAVLGWFITIRTRQNLHLCSLFYDRLHNSFGSINKQWLRLMQ